MAVRKAEAIWEGTLKEGNGTIKLGSGAYEGPYNFNSRFEDGVGTNPEELLGAAHAGCFSMKLNAMLHAEGFAPTRIATTARVHLEKVDDVTMITKIELDVKGVVPNMDAAQFTEMAHKAHDGCIVSIALKNVPTVEVHASLE